MEKKFQLKKNLIFFGSKTTSYLSLGLLHKERPSYRRILQLSKETIQHFKTWPFKKIFYFFGSFFALLDRDPLTRLNPDPDPQPCLRRAAWAAQCPVGGGGAARKGVCRNYPPPCRSAGPELQETLRKLGHLLPLFITYGMWKVTGNRRTLWRLWPGLWICIHLIRIRIQHF